MKKAANTGNVYSIMFIRHFFFIAINYIKIIQNCFLTTSRNDITILDSILYKHSFNTHISYVFKDTITVTVNKQTGNYQSVASPHR